MRITHSMMHRNLLRHIRADYERLHEAQQAVATGKRVRSVSDDPVGATRVLRATRGLSAIAQHRRNSSAARTRLDTEESVLTQITDILTRAREVAITMATDTVSGAIRIESAGEINQLHQQVIQLGNTMVADEHIFGGHQTASSPFQSDGTYIGDAGIHETEIARQYRVQTNHSGDELFVSSGVLSSIAALRDGLAADDVPAVQDAMAALDNAFNQTQTMLIETGAWNRQLDVAAENLDALDATYTLARQAAEGIDLEEAAVDLASIQTTLQASLAAIARVLDTNVTEYIR